MDHVLAIETSTARGTVALARDGALLESLEIDARRRNAAGLLPAVEQLLAAHDVNIRGLAALAFSGGPGSFTGVRVAATVARMLNAVANVPVVRVPTLQAIAARAADAPAAPQWVAALLDAKRGQVFAAAYARAGDDWIEQIRPALVAPGEFGDQLKDVRMCSGQSHDCLLTGDGVAAHRELFESAGFRILDEEELWQPDAAAVLRAALPGVRRGEFCPPAEILPIYLRPPECEEVYESRRAAAKARRGEGLASAGGAT